MDGMGFTDERVEHVVQEALEKKFLYIDHALQHARRARDELASSQHTNGDLRARMLDNYDLAIAAKISEDGLGAAIPLIKEAYGPDNAMAAVLMHLERSEKSPPNI